MNRLPGLILFALVLASAPSPAAAESDDALRAEFQEIVDGLNDNTFREFHDAINDREFATRVAGTRVIENEAREALTENLTEAVESLFIDSFPPARSLSQQGEIIGTIIAFEGGADQARAIVRYEGKEFRFTYHSYDLVGGRGGRVKIVDWFDHYAGSWFSELIGNELVRTMPSQRAVAAVLEMGAPSEAQLFQVGELLKTVRDNNWGRYFQIHEGLEEALRQEPFVVQQHYRLCNDIAATFNYQADSARQEQSSEEDEKNARGLLQAARQADRRLDEAVQALASNFPGDGRFSLGLANYYIMRGRYAEAIGEFERFQEALGMKDGATESMKATAAMALGDFERAQALAVSATGVEPTLELAWWTLLRTRTAGEDYAGATEALTVLEDRFGHLLIPEKLRRDRFLKVLIDQQAYQDWRAQRDAA